MHPQAPKMQLVKQNVRIFVPDQESLYRRLSVRECARIQTFPDDYKFVGSNKDIIIQIGNVVAVKFAYEIFKHINITNPCNFYNLFKASV